MSELIKVLIHTDFPLAKTGLGRNGLELALALHRTGKYQIVYYCSGMSVWHPEYAKFPFKVVGCLPNNAAEMEQINRADEGYRRFCTYGGYYIERILQEEKPDVAIFSNDSWAFPYQDRPWWDKFPCVCHITLDSLPFLPDQKKMIEKTKNFYVWASFAEKEAHRLGFNHVKTLTGIINPKDFHKIGLGRRAEIRSKAGLNPNSFVVGFVFRNQIRKEIFPLMKGFAQYRKENPTVDAYLYFHTHWSEGWDIHRMADELGVPKNLILTTYICRNCHQYEISQFLGQERNCRCCGAEKALITANVQNGVSEQQLNEIYNVFDLYCHPFNAAGLEIPIAEALAAERVVATTPYAAGTMFTDQEFCFDIAYTEGIQFQTQFIRAVPSAFSICKIMDKVQKLGEVKREQIGREGRAWMLQTFSPEVVCKQWEAVIDSLGKTNYDFKFSYEAKNDKFPFPNIADVGEFIKALYNEILKCNPDPSGFEHWQNAIKNGTPREQIYAYFIELARKDNEAHGIGVKTLEDFLEKNERPRLLVVLKESFGDCLYATGLVTGFVETYPDHDVYVATQPQYFELFEHLGVRLIPYHETLESEIFCTGQGQNKGAFDRYCNLGVCTQRQLNYLTNNRLPILA